MFADTHAYLTWIVQRVDSRQCVVILVECFGKAFVQTVNFVLVDLFANKTVANAAHQTLINPVVVGTMRG